ncbi:MAG: DUF502 domain-containing protein [Halobacteriales archaeon]
MSNWKRDVTSGLIILVPIIVTLYVVLWIYGAIANVPILSAVIDKDSLPPVMLGDEVLLGDATVAELVRFVITLVTFGLLVLSIGYLMRTALGDVFERGVDDLINRIPGLRIVYNASKMAVETAVTGGGELQAPVKLETWDGMRMTAFKTGKRTADGREIVFLPTSPNITTGFVVEVDPDDLTETDERVEDALTRVLSAGFGETDAETAMEMIGADPNESKEE